MADSPKAKSAARKSIPASSGSTIESAKQICNVKSGGTDVAVNDCRASASGYPRRLINTSVACAVVVLCEG